MSLVVGTAGHIDHGKTSLLRALTGIDADRLPEERARGMTIDLGYAHVALGDGRVIDFVDVPGHDRLVGNMLVGAGEIDAALLVVAADDGPRPQTLEHLALLDALAVQRGVAAVTKADLVGPERVEEVLDEVRRLVANTGLRGIPVVAVSTVTGLGLEDLRACLARLAAMEAPLRHGDPVRLAVDRAFRVRGRGLVVTGSLRGGGVRAGSSLRLVPAGDAARAVRVREVQVRGRAVEEAGPGRTALNLVGVHAGAPARGTVLTDDPEVAATDRLLVALEPPAALGGTPVREAPWPPRDRSRARLHLGTDATDAIVGRSGRSAVELDDGRVVATLRLSRAIAAAAGDRFVLRRPSPGVVLAGGVVLDVAPARGTARRRQTAERVGALTAAVARGRPEAIAAARLDLHGVTVPGAGPPALAVDVRSRATLSLMTAVEAHHRSRPTDPGPTLPALRDEVTRVVRRMTGLAEGPAHAAADVLLGDAVAGGLLVRDADRLRRPEHRVAGPDPALLDAMDRLESALATNAPPALAATAAGVGCPPDGIRALERSGRIVILEPDLAWAATTHGDLAARALDLARRGPLTPAAYRDATGTSRRFALAILEDLDRRGILRRTDAGHLPGPRAPAPASPGSTTPAPPGPG